ncbi:CAP domain-containing protein [Stutzerimonas tarimensis]|uniref:CAP domain-containing protein n=1 Tax=Stutzerimonas tarimensis TaxID=1507735 RepID=A0ABV7SZM6_9GAMM
MDGGAVQVKGVALALALGLVTGASNAAEEGQLAEAINAYRGQLQSCRDAVGGELPPLASDSRLMLPADGAGDLQESLAEAGYLMAQVRAISLSGPRDAQAAMGVLQESFCQVLLDPRFVDLGVSRAGRDWRIVLARPLLSRGLGDWQGEGQRLLDEVNAARRQARQCGEQAFAAAPPLSWNPALAMAAEAHSRAMANGNFYSHLDRDGRIPGDRADLAGFIGGQVAQNIAAARDRAPSVVAAWLATPGDCARLMNPASGAFGGAYAVDPQSDAGIYWTALFGES